MLSLVFAGRRMMLTCDRIDARVAPSAEGEVRDALEAHPSRFSSSIPAWR